MFVLDHAGLTHGGRDKGAPGLRPQYRANHFGAFLYDPSATASKRSALVRNH